MYRHFHSILTREFREFLSRHFGLDLPLLVVEEPPAVSFGEYALPLSFELARKLRKPPRKIAEEIVAHIGSFPGFNRAEVAGAGYINLRLDRAETAQFMVAEELGHATETPVDSPGKPKMLVEHTSINPNKAAHIGHLRNAILGDTFVRLLRSEGYPVDVQNYIDNTGVQVADVVAGFIYLEKKSKADIAALIARNPQGFDSYCWDLYASVSQWYENDAQNEQARVEVLHAIEEGMNEIAEIAELIATTVLRRHLETMQRLGIVYDFLPRESEILHLHFWDLAFEQLKQKGVLIYETEGKNKGCWVMKRRTDSGGIRPGSDAKPENGGKEDQGPTLDDKIIVRSSGTVTYVGKDIAYHLWKFGLLGRDFEYRKFFHYPQGAAGELYAAGHDCWISATVGETEHPGFGGVKGIYNVIDSRQEDPQNNVIDALRSLGYKSEADHYTHISYEMVALTPRCALELGYQLSTEDRQRLFIEVSGRKGFGVKADDLIDKLVENAEAEVTTRHPDCPTPERSEIARQIAVGALRYFMLKFTKSSVIAFDFKEALSFEGETGPYCQYAVVRADNIFRKARIEPQDALGFKIDWHKHLEGEAGDEIWQLWLTAGKLSHVVEQCIRTTEPAYLAKFAFQLAQMFNNFYHRHRILSEKDESRREFLLATSAIVGRQLARTLKIMGIDVPPLM